MLLPLYEIMYTIFPQLNFVENTVDILQLGRDKLISKLTDEQLADPFYQGYITALDDTHREFEQFQKQVEAEYHEKKFNYGVRYDI